MKFAMYVLMLGISVPCYAEDKKQKSETISLAKGKITFSAPADWSKQKPRSRIIAYEFSAEPAKKGQKPGRMTVMLAGGSVKANIDRWMGQFTQPDGKATKDVAKLTEKKVKKQKIHLVDVSGTYNDKPGPFAPGVQRVDYRMLAAIVRTEKFGQAFIKFYGHQETIKKHEKSFQKMIDSMAIAD